jgi:hypothetical protein
VIHHVVSVESGLEPPAARAATVAWLQSIGYQLTSPPFLSAVEFERGSMVGNATSIGPQKWRVILKTAFAAREGGGTRADLEWKVTTAGQLGTHVDMAYWRHEVALTEAAARGENPKVGDLNRSRRAAMNGNLWRLIVLTVAMIVPAIMGVLSPGSGLPYFVASILFGTVLYAIFRAPRRL